MDVPKILLIQGQEIVSIDEKMFDDEKERGYW